MIAARTLIFAVSGSDGTPPRKNTGTLRKPARVQGAFVSDTEVSDVVEFLTSENGVSQGSADIESKITDRTKGIVIINPNNPTGALYPKDLLERIVEIARRHELIIFADEIYDRLVMDGKIESDFGVTNSPSFVTNRKFAPPVSST